jgi:hypothetical protein
MALARPLLLTCLGLLLRPVARFCVRHAIRLPDLIEAAKRSLVEAAYDELRSGGGRANSTRVSLMTGVHRRDVNRIEQNGPPATSQSDFIMRILGQWQTDPDFTTSEGKPRVLGVGGERKEFEALVFSVSKEINPSTILAELERVGAIERSPKGIRLIHKSYVPSGDAEAGFRIISKDIDDLVLAGSENVLDARSPAHLHARTEFDSIRPDAIPEIERWFLKEGHHFHARAREFLGQFDQDVNPVSSFTGKGIRAVVSAFSFIAPGGSRGSKK